MSSSSSNIRPGKFLQITAVSNPRIKSIKALAQKKHRDEDSTFLVEGLKLVLDAFENGWQIESLIYNANSHQGDKISQLASKIRVQGAEVLEVNDKVLSSITRRDNAQNVVGVLKQKWRQAPDKLTDKTSVWVALDRVRDPGNLGTIMRTSDCAGVEGIILIGETTDPYSVEATRASMGSIFNVPLVKMTSDVFLNWQKNWEGLTIGTHLDGATDFRQIDYHNDPVLLLMGNEQQGLPDDLAKCCDKLALIPMNGTADSLNLAIATGVMLFHMGKKMPPIQALAGGDK